MTRNTYFTTPIYYVNDVPHLGTAYTTVVCDALRRFHQLRGDDTYMLTGTDEHGLKIERQAKEQGIEPKAFVDGMSARFREAWPQLLIEPNHFLRTTDPEHRAFVQDLWKRIEAKGFLEKGSYEDWYCVGCESFKTEKELLPGNICPLHQKPVEKLKEETFFFKLSQFEKPLLDLYERKPDFIAPETRKNEVISFVQGGLKDLSVSRTSFSWGIPVPGEPAHVMYVWFDALSNYLSALNSKELQRFWPGKGKDTRAVHLVGKDILRFHAVYWPAFLLAAGYTEDELPTQIFAHGFLTVDGQKMSKSLRNAVDPLRLAKELGPDVLRYQLLRAISFGQDGDFDHKALIERYNADLGKNLGNLLNRTLGLCTKMSDGKTTEYKEGPLEAELRARIESNLKLAAAAWENVQPHLALEHTWDISAAANQYVDRAAPWAAAKAGDMERVHTTLAALLEALRILSVLVWPAMPTKSAEMRAQLGLEPLHPSVGSAVWPAGFSPRPAGQALAPTGALFPVFDKDREKEILDRLMPKTEAEVAAPAEAIASKPADKTSAAEGADVAAPPIAYEDFAKVDLRVGIVRTAEKVPKKDKLLRLTVDVGEEAPRNIIAGLALSFTPETLVGRKVVVVANLAPRDFGKGMVSHGMLLATGPSDALELATVAGDAPPGVRLK